MGTWEVVLRDWLAANYINSSSGRHGYKNELGFRNLKIHYAPTDKTSISLYPGEGVYSYVSSSSFNIPTSSETIKYSSLTSTEVSSGPISIGNALLTYNTNTNIGGSAVLGTTTGAAAPVGVVKSVSGSGRQGSTFKGPFPIGMNDVLRRNGHGAGFNKINIKLPKKTTGE
jgi:hypothetical protein